MTIVPIGANTEVGSKFSIVPVSVTDNREYDGSVLIVADDAAIGLVGVDVLNNLIIIIILIQIIIIVVISDMYSYIFI
jgi:hypothetical protein